LGIGCERSTINKGEAGSGEHCRHSICWDFSQQQWTKCRQSRATPGNLGRIHLVRAWGSGPEMHRGRRARQDGDSAK
jgi:hypothetical protein